MAHMSSCTHLFSDLMVDSSAANQVELNITSGKLKHELEQEILEQKTKFDELMEENEKLR